MPLPASHPHQRYSVRGYREPEEDGDAGAGGAAWSCELLRHGQSIGLVSHDGRGGAAVFTFPDAARGREFLAAATALHPGAEHPGDVLVDELLTVRQMAALDRVAYCLDGDRFEELGEHRLAAEGMTLAQVRELLATRYADRSPRVWDPARAAMVPVTRPQQPPTPG